MIEQNCKNCIYGKNKNSFFGTCEEEDVSYCYHFAPKEEIVRQDCIKDFETIIYGINIVEDFDIDRPMEKFMFNRGIKEYKKKLLERLNKYESEINNE